MHRASPVPTALSCSGRVTGSVVAGSSSAHSSESRRASFSAGVSVALSAMSSAVRTKL
jgi:hypothetical protein